MDEFDKRIALDKLLILCGIIGSIASIVTIILGLAGLAAFDYRSLVFLPLGIYFIYYGFKQIEKEKENFHQK